MNKIMLAAMVAAVTLGSSAKTIERVLVARGGGLELYSVSDEDTWTKEKNFCTVSGQTVFGSLCHQGIVYVGSATGGNADNGTVWRYDLNGKQLTSLPTCGFVPWNMAVSPNGRYLFVSSGSGGGSSKTGRCRLYRYDLNEGTAGTWTEFAKSGTDCMRAVTIDDNGNVFWCDRYHLYHVGNCYTDTNLPITASTFKSAAYAAFSGEDSPFTCGARYNPADGLLYFASSKGTDDKRPVGGTVKWDNENSKFTDEMHGVHSSKIAWCDDIIVVNGKPYISANNTSPVGFFKVDFANDANTTCIASGTTYSLERFNYTPSETMEFEEAYAAEVKSSANTQTLWPQGGAIAGADNGISGKCLYFREAKATAKFVNSATMVPATADFMVSMWVGMQAGATERLIFSNRNPLIANDELSLLVDESGNFGLKFNGYDAVTTTAKIDDGKWHHVGVVRNGKTTLELYADGELVGTLAIAATDKVSSDTRRGWHIGCNEYEDVGFLGAGAFVDRVVIDTTQVAYDYDFKTEYEAYKDAEVPVAAPSAPAEVADIPSGVGTKVEHAFACEQSFGSPTLVVIGNTYYLGVSAGEAVHAGCESLRIYQSTDGGETWSWHSTLTGSGATLFASGTTLCAIGMKADSTAAANSYTACAWRYDESGATPAWTLDAQKVLPSVTRVDMQSSQVMINNGVVYKSAIDRTYSSSRGLNYTGYAVSFKIGSDGKLTYDAAKAGGAVLYATFAAYDTCVDVLGGVSVTRFGSKVNGKGVMNYWPMIERRNPAYSCYPIGIERCAAQVTGWNCWQVTNARVNMFRGGSRPFGIVYDESQDRYYAVTVAAASSTEIAGVDSQREITHTLAVYASDDLEAWYPAGTISELGTSVTYGYNGSACVLDGNDLLVATVVGADDGAPGFNKQRSNYLTFRKIENYAATYKPVTPTSKERLYVSDHEHCYRYYSYYRSTDDEWYPSSETITVNSDSQRAAHRLVRRDNRMYGCTYEGVKPARIYEYTLKGALRKMYTAPSSDYSILNFDVSLDHTYAIVATVTANSTTKPECSGVYKVVFADNSWTRIFKNGDSNVTSARSVAIDGNGGFYLGTWNNGTPIKYFKCEEGVYSYGDVTLTINDSTEQLIPGMYLDHENDTLYSCAIRGPIFKWPLDGTSKKLNPLNGDTISGLNCFANQATLDTATGKLYVTSRNGLIRAIDTTTGEMTCPFGAIGSSSAICYVPDITYLGENGLLLLVE